ncbi:MAG: hypothetical protein ABIG66_00530 [Candidatus Kerfeldbacteria bacterium]
MYRKSLFLALKKWWLDNPWIAPLLIFCIAVAAFSLWLASPTFADPDSFYHIKISEMMIKKRQAITEFPWLQFTTLKNAYVDHHLLYHVYLIPFILALGTTVGVKLATILLGSGTVTLFCCLLQKMKVRYSLLFSILLLFSYSFAFRMGLSKAPAVGFLFLTGGFLLMAMKQHRLLILTSFLFVWSYGGFLLLPILAGIYSLIGAFRYVQKNGKAFERKKMLRLFLPLAATVAGTAAGLLIHPSFPQHIIFLWQQIIEIGLINQQNVIGVGNEWYPSEIITLISDNILVAGLLASGLIAFFATTKKQTTASITAGVLVFIFFIFTLKSRRYSEYFIPWAVLFSALSLHLSGALDALPRLLKKAKQKMSSNAVTATAGAVAAIYCLFIFGGVCAMGAENVYDSHHHGIPLTDFADAGKWLRTHSNKGDIVFHSNWDIFPQMFYHVARDRFIVGLDPTFMYNYDQELYWEWVDITKGEQTKNLYEIIGDDFNARFVVIENDHTAMMNNVIADGRFKKTYEDASYTIFRLPRENGN